MTKQRKQQAAVQPLRVGLAQIEVIPNRPDLNCQTMLEMIAAARQQQLELLVFPEMALPGYLLGDEWENNAFVLDCSAYNQEILAASQGLVVIWGNVVVDESRKGEDGRLRKFNAALVAQNGQWVSNGIFKGYTPKTAMPDYGEFDDDRYFYSLPKLAWEQKRTAESLLAPFVVNLQGQPRQVGVLLCEDQWASGVNSDYAVTPVQTLLEKGAELIVNLSCSPWKMGKADKRSRVIRESLQGYAVPALYVNNVGWQNDVDTQYLFDGGSTVYEATGAVQSMATLYQEELLVACLAWPTTSLSRVTQLIDRSRVDSVPVVTRGPRRLLKMHPLTPALENTDFSALKTALVYGLRQFFHSHGFKQVVVGLSGGIDSGLSATLLAEALGPDQVYAVNMPSVFNSAITQKLAARLATELGIHYGTLPIQAAVTLTATQLREMHFVNSTGEKTHLSVSDFTLQNIQARDRGSRLLAGLAACLGGVFTNNGNKTEIGFGYATLYGDVCGAIAPLGDLFKGQVYGLAKRIALEHNLSGLVGMADIVPSAELTAEQAVGVGQGDPFYYAYHDALLRAFVEFRLDPEDLLRAYLKGHIDALLGIKLGVTHQYFPQAIAFCQDLEEKWRLYKGAIFKRGQAPMIIRVSRRGFGHDLRESMPRRTIYFTRYYRALAAACTSQVESKLESWHADHLLDS